MPTAFLLKLHVYCLNTFSPNERVFTIKKGFCCTTSKKIVVKVGIDINSYFHQTGCCAVCAILRS